VSRAVHRVDLVDLEPAPTDFAAEAIRGLGSVPKTLPCKLFYDKRGSELFERICSLPEYYPTRTEIGIMRRYRDDIVALLGPRIQLVELGSGSSLKTRILLDALDAPASYVPVDISRDHLWESAQSIQAAYPELPVQAVCADYMESFEVPASARPEQRRVVFFPGSTIGNFHEPDARRFLARIADLLGPGGGLLIGADLRKDAATLVAAYDDSQGVTAEFNLNVLHRLNREAASDFVVEQFFHRSVWNDTMGRIEMHLVSRAPQRVRVAGETFQLAAGEPIRTECAYKYRLSQFAELAEGFEVRQVWVDDRQRFSVQYLVVPDDGGARGGTHARTGAAPKVL
jgi:dimethylhistidine N-methyltransferase